MPDLAAVQSQAAQLRATVDQSQRAFNAADAAFQEAQAKLAAAKRTGGDIQTLKAQADRAAQAKSAAADRRAAAVSALQQQIGSLLGTLSPDAALTGLDPLVPLVLLPVRLETRFNPKLATELMVRILPDDIHGDSHEPELTSAEVSAGQDFWIKTWRAGTQEPAATAGEQNAWADLVAQVGIRRAAWVANSLSPTNPSARPAQPTAADAPLAVSPAFGSPTLRGDTWTRAPWTTAMPDRWVILGYSGGKRIATAWGKPVPEHVHMGPDPAAKPDANSPAGVDAGLSWVVDFSAAEAIGLGIRVPVPTQGGGIDRLFAFGVRASLDPASSAARLASLFGAHHYTNGISFLPQDTPTNNTPSDRSGWSSRPTAASTFAVERRPQMPPPSSNGGVYAAAFGIDPSLFQSVEHALDTEQTAAASMATLLWGPTMGYFLEQMLQYQGPDANQIATVRRHFIDFVRGRGPLPAVRIGNQPYGLLPVTSLQRWKAFDEDLIAANIAPILRAAQPFWAVGATSAPRLGGSGDLDQDFVHALTMDARSRLLRVRTIHSVTYCREVQPFFPQGANIDPCGASEAIADAAWAAFDLRGGLLGHSYHPRVADVVFSAEAATLRLPLVDGAPGPANYLQTLRTEPLTQISSDATHGSTSTSVLATLARHAVLLAYGAAADELGSRGLPGSGTASPNLPVRPEAEMFGVSAQVAAANPRFEASTISPTMERLFSSVPNVTGTQTAADFLRAGVIKAQTGVTGQFVDPTLLEIDNALADLASRPVDELEGLLCETLDVVSHRLDAWITSLATRRLQSLRGKRPKAIYLGGFGWVEGLTRRPADPAAAVPAGETGPLVADVNGGGFIHAPSLTQAATGAVLRSANISHANTASASDGALAIDLSSRRVYLAMELLDGVRAGQPLGALLGYRLERALHENHAPLELDRYIAPLRAMAPLVANRVTPAGAGESIESISARNVVDGLALSRIDPAQVRANLVASVTSPPATAAELNAVLAEIASMDDAIDGLSDLLLSESVYHIIQGNPMRAGMTVDALNRGSISPDPEVIRTNKSGTAVTHRLLVLLSGGAMAVATGWPDAGPRRSAEPRLDSWAGQLLGDPSQVRLRVAYVDAGGATTELETPLSAVIAGDEPLAAIDILYDANATNDGKSTLEQRLADRLAISPLPDAPTNFTSIGLIRGRKAAWPPTTKSLTEFVTVAAALRSVVTGGRYLTAVDLARPEGKPQPRVDSSELGTRATEALAALEDAAGQMDRLLNPSPSTDTVALLRAVDSLAAFGMLPPGKGVSTRDSTAVLQEAQTLLGIANSRLASAAKLQAAPRPPDDLADAFDLSTLAAVFGEDFRALPICRPDNASVLSAGFSGSAALQGGDTGKAWEWLRRSATVRPSAARLSDAMLFAEALGTGAETHLRVAQVPLVAGSHWAGLPEPPPADPTTTFVAHSPGAIDPSSGIAGLFLDEWNEVVPATTQITGITFQTGTPRARAPQAILLAVSPDPQKPWDLDTIEALLTETFELAQQRLVDLDTLPWTGHFLPATYIADSAFNSTPSVHWKDIVAAANQNFQAKRLTGSG